MGLKVGKGDTLVNSSADTLTTYIYNFSFTCVDCIIQLLEKGVKKLG